MSEVFNWLPKVREFARACCGCETAIVAGARAYEYESRPGKTDYWCLECGAGVSDLADEAWLKIGKVAMDPKATGLDLVKMTRLKPNEKNLRAANQTLELMREHLRRRGVLS